MRLGLGLHITGLRAGGEAAPFALASFFSGAASSDAITHTRAGNATMVDSDGLLKWAPHNLIKQSADISGSDWTVARATTPAPDFLAMDATDAATHSIAQVLPTQSIGAAYTYEVELEADGVTIAYVFTRSEDGSSTQTWFDLSAGVVGTDTSSGATILPLGGGRYLCRVPFDIPTADTTASIVTLNLAETDGVAPIATATEGAGFFVRRSRYYRSDLGGMVNNPDTGDSYVPTTSTAVYLPRRGHHIWDGTSWVNEGLLHESEARANLLPESNDLTVATGAWNNINVTTTGTSQGPDGVSDSATQMLEAAITGEHQVGETFSFSPATSYTLSAFVNSIGGRDCTLFWFTNSANTILQASFDLTSGTVLSGPTASGSAPPTNVAARIEKVGNFYRVSISGLTGGTAGLGQARIHASEGATFNYAGDVTKGLEVYGAQLEAASTPSSYIPTSGATVTRSAETLTVPAANLPWPSPVVIGEELWNTPTISDPAVWSWDGSTLTATGDGTSDTARGDAVTAGGLYQISFTVGASGSGLFQVRVGNTFVATLTGGANQSYSYLKVATDTTGLTFTDTGSTTAVISNISVREIDPLAVSIQMQGKMTYADDGTSNILVRWRSGTPGIQTNVQTDGANTGKAFFYQWSDASVLDSVNTSGNPYSPGINVPFNIASRHGSTFLNGAVDGTALTANTTPVALPDLETTDLDLGFDYMGTISEFRVWGRDIGDTGIEEESA